MSDPDGYYAVIFTSQRANADPSYEEMAVRMAELARTQPGFLGMQSARGPEGAGITVSYWKTEAAIGAWKENAEHLLAQERGRKDWYSSYEVRIARVERAYGMRQP
ncbi:MAG: antibiotic biosynthesis monooxygenase [marine benthic group bacterium]|jgi:heme-degrading monooxygenase HmoA|nr:antibiotic biosynthesis monooxygenase [Gemmatimonadota bacterium]